MSKRRIYTERRDQRINYQEVHSISEVVADQKRLVPGKVDASLR